MGPKEHCCIGPIPFDGFVLHFTLLFSSHFGFSGTAYHRGSKPVPLDSACLKTYICATQAILMHFSQSKSTKCEMLGCLLNSPWHKMKKKNINFNRDVLEKA